jgi:hypothetical protein
MRSALIEPTDARWSKLLRARQHDFYHLPDYAVLSARQDGGEARALLVEGAPGESMLLPLVHRSLGDGLSDVTSPYGYGGPLVEGSPRFLRDALLVGYDALAQEGVISLFVRLHPILNDDIVSELPGTVVDHGETVVIDLSKSERDLWSETRKSHRHQINRARRSGYRVYLATGLTRLADFAAMYRATMRRRRAHDYYLFEDDYFEDLATALGPRFNLFVLEHDEAIAAAGIFVETDGIVQSHLTADEPALSRGGSKKLLYDAVRRWAQERGDRWFHLGGGVGAASDSLWRFKAGFSQDRRRFRTLRVVVRETEFEGLAADGIGTADGSDEDFFPPYRGR